MKYDMRNNLDQVTEIFVGAVKKTADAVMLYSKPVFSAYVIRQLQNDIQKTSMCIGMRITRLVQEGRSDITRDAELLHLTAGLKVLEEELSKRINQKRILNLF